MKPLLEKWPRNKALEIRTIIQRIGLCGCGTDAHWICVLELLEKAAANSARAMKPNAVLAVEIETEDKGFYRDQWFEFGAKVLDSWDLLDHGTSIGWAWLTDDGELLLEFLRDFGTEDANFNDDSGHPLWCAEFNWKEKEEPGDTYWEWEQKVSAEPK